MGAPSKNISYSRALDIIESGAVSGAAFKKDTLVLETTKGDKYTANMDAAAPEERARLHTLLQKQKVSYKIEKPPITDMIWTIVVSVILPVAMLLFFWMFIIRSQQGGGSAMNFGRSKAKKIEDNGQKVTFSDVAGIDEAKTELGEVVDFLRDAKKYQKLGARIPKGILLLGPPGCGKTLLARAIAGEAKVPFFYISGSDFVEMFVGVGASRVRDLFNNAKESRPCLVFIDEIDAVGRHRGTGIGGGNDEREQTLNQLLIEMDGFETNSGVILVAATNRPDVLDPALLRPGRFDRQITVDLPDVKGREKILLVHAKNKPLGDDVDFKTLAARTAGFSGAELANLVNEAALLAARLDQKEVTAANFSEAIDKVLAGPERKSMTLNPEEKKMTAYHEAGHAIVIETLAAGDKVQKVSIMPRGRALGLTWHTPQEDRYTQTRSELLNRVCGLLGGRVTEAMVYDEITTGAANDLERASGIVRTMICELGMSENLGPIVFGKHSGNPFLGKDIYESRNYSESVAQAIDAEIKRIIEECYARTEEILLARRDALDRLAGILEEKETIERDEFLSVAFPDRYEQEYGRPGDGEAEAPAAGEAEAAPEETPDEAGCGAAEVPEEAQPADSDNDTSEAGCGAAEVPEEEQPADNDNDTSEE
ncbi:MAG: ATP-dependent zinc metalloprotease FtsH [Abditibacteriota bacterium]|nr:ATP-dependent zinc metalloprotease FtsH [Abditibacteriota bacterium]